MGDRPRDFRGTDPRFPRDFKGTYSCQVLVVPMGTDPVFCQPWTDHMFLKISYNNAIVYLIYRLQGQL